jgi:hypothetical protein
MSGFPARKRLVSSHRQECRKKEFEMKRHHRQALICSVAAAVLAIVALFAFLGAPRSSEGAGEAIGRVLVLSAVAGLVCGWIAGRSPLPWSWPKFVGIYLTAFIVVLVVSAYGNSTKSDAAETAPATKLSIRWPQGWTVQHLVGISSAPEDRDLGYRERGILGDAKSPTAVIEVSCLNKPAQTLDNAEQIDSILANMRKGYESQGFIVSMTAAAPTRIGNYDGLTARMDAKRGEVDLLQNFSIAQSSNCLLTMTLTAKQADYDANLKTYDEVKASVK